MPYLLLLSSDLNLWSIDIRLLHTKVTTAGVQRSVQSWIWWCLLITSSVYAYVHRVGQTLPCMDILRVRVPIPVSTKCLVPDLYVYRMGIYIHELEGVGEYWLKICRASFYLAHCCCYDYSNKIMLSLYLECSFFQASCARGLPWTRPRSGRQNELWGV